MTPIPGSEQLIAIAGQDALYLLNSIRDLLYYLSGSLFLVYVILLYMRWRETKLIREVLVELKAHLISTNPCKEDCEKTPHTQKHKKKK